jgi:two-component system chemotaxis response regulator CheY
MFNFFIGEQTMSKEDFRILIVDDFPIMRGIIKRMLNKRFGLTNIVEADDGVKAWSFLNEGKIDLMICDWNMPNMTGISLLKKVREDKRFANLPFIMVTAEGKKENVIEATKAGVTGFIVKPFTAKDLGKKLKPLIPEE